MNKRSTNKQDAYTPELAESLVPTLRVGCEPQVFYGLVCPKRCDL